VVATGGYASAGRYVRTHASHCITHCGVVTAPKELLDAFISRDGVQNVLGTVAATASSKLFIPTKSRGTR